MTEQQALDALTVPDLLVLDEVGVQFGSEAEKIIGFEIINTRYEAMKPTIILSNLTMDELVGCLGDRVIDRLRENGGKAIEFVGESRRGMGLVHRIRCGMSAAELQRREFQAGRPRPVDQFVNPMLKGPRSERLS